MTFSTTTSSKTLNKPVLREGSTGEAVKELQELLLPHGVFTYINYDHVCVYPGEEVIDGVFGSHTTNAVKLFQSKVFLSEDGIVGDKTWRTLYLGAPVDMPILRKGSKGILVEKIQYRLSDAGYYQSIIDGDFGTATEAAVRDLQAYIGLPIDGIVGDRTWFELSKIFITSC